MKLVNTVTSALNNYETLLAQLAKAQNELVNLGHEVHEKFDGLVVGDWTFSVEGAFYKEAVFKYNELYNTITVSARSEKLYDVAGEGSYINYTFNTDGFGCCDDIDSDEMVALEEEVSQIIANVFNQ